MDWELIAAFIIIGLLVGAGIWNAPGVRDESEKGEF